MQLLISDLHLDPSRPAVARAFFDFLSNRATQATDLYILGDLFELWIGDDEDEPFYLEIKQALAALTAAGITVSFIHGNRDFLLGEKFARETGLCLLDEQVVVEFAQQRCLLMHGDTLCTADTDYQQFRAQVRRPQWQNDVLGKSIEQRRELGRQLRLQSKTMASRKADDIMDVTQSEIEKVLRDSNCKILIHGHTHRPARHEFNIDGDNALRLVLGDWDDFAWCIEVEDNRIDLISWPIR